MIAKVRSKDELQSLSGVLKNLTSSFTAEAASVIGNLGDSEDFDGIVITGAAMSIQNNLKVVSSEIEALSSKILNYVTDINTLDTYDFDISKVSVDNSNSKNDNEVLFLFTDNDNN